MYFSLDLTSRSWVYTGTTRQCIAVLECRFYGGLSITLRNLLVRLHCFLHFLPLCCFGDEDSWVFSATRRSIG